MSPEYFFFYVLSFKALESCQTVPPEGERVRMSKSWPVLPLTKLRVLSLVSVFHSGILRASLLRDLHPWKSDELPAWHQALNIAVRHFFLALFYFLPSLFLNKCIHQSGNLLCKSQCAGQFGAPYHCDITTDGKMELARQHPLSNQFYTRRRLRGETELLLCKFYVRPWCSWTTCMPIKLLPAAFSPAF